MSSLSLARSSRVVVEAKRVCDWVSERIGSRQGFSDYSAIGLERNGSLIAGVVYDYFNGASINMHVAAIPGANWLNREFLHFCFWYPFGQLKVRRVTGIVPESNLAARRFDEKLGFTLEARLTDAAPDGDVLIYRMFSHECRWLNLKVNYEQAISARAA